MSQIDAVPNGTTRSTTVADRVHLVQGPSVNWIIVEGDLGPVLIDTGYPGDGAAVTATLGALGYAVEDVRAILLTHGHSDHIGNATFIAGLAECDILASRDEIPNVRREVLEQVGLADVQPHLERPGVADWVSHAVEAGGLEVVPPASVTAIEDVPSSGRSSGSRSARSPSPATRAGTSDSSLSSTVSSSRATRSSPPTPPALTTARSYSPRCSTATCSAPASR